MSTTDWKDDAFSDAKDTVREYMDAIVAFIMDGEDVSDDLLNDYGNGDAYHHESHVDKEYSLLDAAELLASLADHVETDRGLWEGLEPTKAISAQAAYTYGNAVYSDWTEIIKQINDHDAIDAIRCLVNAWDDRSDEDTEAIKKFCVKIIESIIE